MHTSRAAWLAAMLPLSAAAAPVTSPDFPGVVCETIWVPMRDGTLLATDMYSPSAAGQYPVIVERNPYGRAFGDGCFQGLGASLAGFAQHGYVALAQDVRGTNRSQGAFREMVQEAKDGYDAIEWAAAQPWSTGRVGTTSGSYLGLTQWQPAIHRPPHLAAICPQITASDYHDNWTYVNAVFDLWFGMSWPPGWVADQMTRGLQAQGVAQSDIDALVNDFNATVTANLATKWVYGLPLTAFDQFTTFAPYYYDWLDHPVYDDFWERLDVERHWSDVQVPALISTAWYDIFQVGAFRNFAGMRSEGGTADARRGTKLLVGPYGHAGDSGKPTFGADPIGALLSVDSQLRFFDRYLKGLNNGYENDPNVTLYVLLPPDTGNTGSGFVVQGDSYPLPGTQWHSLYLSSGGHANSSKGDGQLAWWPSNSPSDHYDYDPSNPVPTAGGNMCCNAVLLADGAQDQTQVELRPDVLVYTSGTLDRDLAVIGPVDVKLWAETSAPDTDFTAKLVDVHLDGATHNVLDRVVRASFRAGSKLPPSNVTPGKPYEYVIPLGNAGTIFKKGHRIRLEISSSNFPHYDRNLNTGKVSEWTSDMAVAHQTILHDGWHPSHLVLPVAPVTAPKS
ncbi:MAG TPA: CocE/NonD family hydrolase [Anaeromyxobacteraceae bacterium]|nr:CocE/NonD family hydrolase [Anaeromyxobacteraceae bacterium]